jgi:hypothetical protein
MNDFLTERRRINLNFVPVRQPRLGMALSGPMARFAGNAKLGGARIDRSPAAIHAWFNAGSMTSTANHVPDFGPVYGVGRTHEGRIAGNPAPFRKEPRERKSKLGITLVAENPKNLHVM